MIRAVEADPEAASLGARLGLRLLAAANVLNALKVSVREDGVVEREQRGTLESCSSWERERGGAMRPQVEKHLENAGPRVVGILDHFLFRQRRDSCGEASLARAVLRAERESGKVCTEEINERPHLEEGSLGIVCQDVANPLAQIDLLAEVAHPKLVLFARAGCRHSDSRAIRRPGLGGRTWPRAPEDRS